MTELVLIRGLPGSGKSTLAKAISGVHYETDMFWGPEYNFDMTRIKEAHQWCQDAVRISLEQNVSRVIVSNTFTTQWELIPYFDMAKEFGIVPQVILCQGRWGSVHNVPDEVMQKMNARFEFDIAGLFGRLI
jgi:energy-coupling factor transporter ATP-binding protein EcfA2